jgi:hypothetical protein
MKPENKGSNSGVERRGPVQRSVGGFLRRIVGAQSPAIPVNVPEPDPKFVFCRELTLLKHRAMELGLFQTMHRIDDAIRMAGFEVAGTPEACRKYEKATQRVIDRAQGGGS